MEATLAWMWLADAVGSAFPHAAELLAQWPQPLALYRALQEGAAPPACLNQRALGILRTTHPYDYEMRLDHCLLSGYIMLTPDSADYPERLRALPDLPLMLYATGETACLNRCRYAGVVGTRRPTAYGRQVCREVAGTLAAQGVVVVSGLADGLDGESHLAAVRAGAPTVAFLGTGIDVTFPAANEGLRRDIERTGGCAVSEYPPRYTGKTKATFLARNRLIAGLSEVLCVAEARLRSGTLNTVAHAERYGRRVLAVPGSIYSAQSQGTNDLLRTGRAGALCGARDVLDALGMGTAQQPEEPAPLFDTTQLSMAGAAVYAALTAKAQGIDELAAKTGLSTAHVLAACTELELAGGIQCAPGRRYLLP